MIDARVPFGFWNEMPLGRPTRAEREMLSRQREEQRAELDRQIRLAGQVSRTVGNLSEAVRRAARLRPYDCVYTTRHGCPFYVAAVDRTGYRVEVMDSERRAIAVLRGADRAGRLLLARPTFDARLEPDVVAASGGRPEAWSLVFAHPVAEWHARWLILCDFLQDGGWGDGPAELAERLRGIDFPRHFGGVRLHE